MNGRRWVRIRLPTWGSVETLRDLGNLEAFAVAAVAIAEHTIGLRVVDDFFLRGVEVQRAAEAVRYVRQVHQGAGNVAFFNRRAEVFLLAAAHAIDEVGEVILLALAFRSGLVMVAQPGLVALVLLDGQISLGAVVEISDGAGLAAH